MAAVTFYWECHLEKAPPGRVSGLQGSQTQDHLQALGWSPAPSRAAVPGCGAQRLGVGAYPFLIEPCQETIGGKGSRSYKTGTDIRKERKWETGVVKSHQHFR